MSVELQYIGRLGNQLFQYAFGRILAEALGYELRCVAMLDRPAESSILVQPLEAAATLPELISYFENARQFLPGKCVTEPEERYIVGCEGPDGLRWDGHTIDLQALLCDRRERKLVLRGYFQRFEYYREHRAKLREWFAHEPLADSFGITKRDILVNIRRGWDMAVHGWILAMSAYKRLLSEVPHDRVFVCGIGIDDAVREALGEFSPIYYSSTPIDEFRFIMKFDKIVQSNSTFCWWASFLSDASVVFTPQPDRGFFSKELGGDALNTGEQRYRLFDAKLARCIPFQPNPAATVMLEKDPSGETFLIIERPIAAAVKIRCAPRWLHFYDWFAQRREPFGVEQLVQDRLMTRSQVERVIGPLIETGAIVLEPHFPED